MSKSFAQAPKPRQLTPENIAAFEQGGAGQDTQTRVPAKAEMRETANVEKQEPTRRLSVDLPESLHRRFKVACSAADKKMVVEVAEFIARRTAELEKLSKE
jgi:hypothetical protein